MFRVKRVNLHLRNDVRTADIYIILYEKPTVRLTSVGLVQARPNYIITDDLCTDELQDT